MTTKKQEPKAMKNPIEWLFHMALLVLGAVVALTLALQLLAAIWMWVVGAGLVVGGALAWYRIASARRRNW